MNVDMTGELMSRFEYCSQVAATFANDWVSFFDCMNGVGGCLPGEFGSCLPDSYEPDEDYPWGETGEYPADWPHGGSCLDFYEWQYWNQHSPWHDVAVAIICSRCPDFYVPGSNFDYFCAGVDIEPPIDIIPVPLDPETPSPYGETEPAPIAAQR